MIGDAPDIEARLKRNLPASWFGYIVAAVLSAVLGGVAWALSHIYALIVFARLQARLATATGGWLDLAANDFFGRALPRFSGEVDRPYSVRVRQEVFRQRNTRAALDSIVYDLTGKHPLIVEPFHSGDHGGWGSPGFAWGGVGSWGGASSPYEVFLYMPFPEGYGVPERGGWGSQIGGWGTGNWSWVPSDLENGLGPQIEDILRRIDQVRAAGVTVYVRFTQLGTPD